MLVHSFKEDGVILLVIIKKIEKGYELYIIVMTFELDKLSNFKKTEMVINLKMYIYLLFEIGDGLNKNLLNTQMIGKEVPTGHTTLIQYEINDDSA